MDQKTQTQDDMLRWKVQKGQQTGQTCRAAIFGFADRHGCLPHCRVEFYFQHGKPFSFSGNCNYNLFNITQTHSVDVSASHSTCIHTTYQKLAREDCSRVLPSPNG